MLALPFPSIRLSFEDEIAGRGGEDLLSSLRIHVTCYNDVVVAVLWPAADQSDLPSSHRLLINYLLLNDLFIDPSHQATKPISSPEVKYSTDGDNYAAANESNC